MLLRSVGVSSRLSRLQRIWSTQLVFLRFCQRSTRPSLIHQPVPRTASNFISDSDGGELWRMVHSGDCENRHYYILLRYASAERTLDVIKLMLERKVLMKESVLKTIHNKFIGSKYADRVFELFEGHCLAGNHDEDNRLVENLFLFYVSAKLLDRSRSLFDRLTAAGTAGKFVYHAMMKAYSREGDLAQVQTVYNRMLAAGFEPGGYTMSTIITAFGISGAPRKAEQLFDKVKNLYTEYNQEMVHSAMVSCYLQVREYRNAEKRFLDMVKNGPAPRRSTFNIMLKVFVKTNNVEGARKLLVHMRESGIEPDLRAYNELILCYGDAGRVAEAQELFDTLVVSGPPPDFFTYNLIMKIQGAAGNLKRACAMLSQMKEAGITPNLVIYSTLIRLHCLALDMTGAEQLFQVMLADGIKPDARVFNIMIEGYNRSNEMVKAENVVFQMLRRGVKPGKDTLNQLIRNYVLHDNSPRAEMLFDAVKAQGVVPADRAYAKLIRAHSKDNNMEKVGELTKEMLSKGVEMSTEVCNELIVGCISGGNFDDALHVFDMMKADGIHKDRATYSILINAFARTYGYRHPFVYDLLREWRQSDYYEMLPSGTIFVNLIPFSVHVAKATVWTALRDLEPEGPLCLFVGDGCMNVLTSNENGPLQTNVKLTIHKMLTELRVNFKADTESHTFSIYETERKAFKERVGSILEADMETFEPLSLYRVKSEDLDK